MEKIKVKIQQTDNGHRELKWPYGHVSRIDERFTIGGVGSKHEVSNVYYNQTDDGFVAIVFVPPLAQ